MASLIYTGVIILVAVLFVQQALAAPARSRKQQAFAVAAAAVGLLALVNVMFLLNFNIAPLILPVRTLAVLLLAVSAVLLFQAWRSGEMNSQMQQVQTMLQSEREHRRQQSNTVQTGQQNVSEDTESKT